MARLPFFSFTAGIALAIALQLPATAVAEERRLTGAEIETLLAGAKIVGKGFEQTFGDPRGQTDASTTYWEGTNQSLGRWNVQGDKYCSVWNNPQYWACYTVFTEPTDTGMRVIWVDDGGRRFTGLVQNRQ